ncbi:MAG: UDP-3-O-(3-hydroxymyristoyl)glucosamine N-acyltransferase [Acidobacteria bacterium SCN 69-37]|nr:MAG: UDP-3-O-(3-hydroxymyristoyl)glucosamine N-acyltransferase [Acidobacteria bacterium SCN 69-37]
MTLADLAERLGCRLDGDGTLEITGVAALDDAGPGDVTFLANSKYAARLPGTRATAVIADDSTTGAPCAVLRTVQPYLAWAEAVSVLSPVRRPSPGISPLASIDPTATLGPDVHVGPFAVVGAGATIGARVVIEPQVVIGAGVSVGADTILRAHVSLREGVEVGARVILHDGVVVGTDGFGFARRPDGTHQKIPQNGRVVIEDDVEIGAQSAVDRPAVGETRIACGTKIDNLVQVAHGVHIGRNVLLAAQVGIAGSTVLDDDVIMAGQSGSTGHVHLGRGARVGAKSAVTKDVPAGGHVAGIPAVDLGDWREIVVLGRRLPGIRRDLADLEGRLAAVEQRLK